MHKKITDVAIKELSLIFGEHKGERWQPINEEARVLSVKGTPDKGVVAKALETLKGYFFADYQVQYPVTQAEDNIDNDGDGPEDYNAIVSAVCSLYSDISNAYGISDDEARSAAIVGAIDSFIAGLDQMRGVEKAGKRHSKADTEHLQAMLDGVASHVKAMNEHLAALGVGDSSGESETKDESNDNPKPDDEDGATKAEAVEANGEAGVLPDLESLVKGQVDTLITAKAAEFEQQIATVKADAQSQMDTLKAESESRVAGLEAQLQEVTARAESAEATVKAMVSDARKPSSPGFVPTAREDGTRDDPAAEVTKAEAIAQVAQPSKIADVIRLQRLVQS